MKLEINNPCHENWEAMTPNEKGAFCLSCKKDVVDFTKKSTSEIKKYFSSHSLTEKVCGRFQEKQLEDLTFDHFFAKYKYWNFLNKSALIIFFVFGLSLFGCAQSRPEKPPVIKMGTVAYIPPDTTRVIQKRDSVKRPIKGKVKVTPDKPKKKVQQRPPEIMGDVMVEDPNLK